jgi:signal transduction histidine kinase
MSDGETPWPAIVSLAVHELRTPVNVAAGYVKMVLGGYGGDLTDAQRHVLAQADGSTARMTEILSDLSDIGRLEGGRLPLTPMPVQVFGLLSDACSRFVAPPGFSGACRLGPSMAPATLTVDRRRVARALAALATLVARRRPSARAVVLDVIVRDSDVVVTIADDAASPTGAGLEPLGTLPEFEGGLGVSVPLARRVVEACGGRVGVLPDGAGASLGVVLPRS